MSNAVVAGLRTTGTGSGGDGICSVSGGLLTAADAAEKLDRRGGDLGQSVAALLMKPTVPRIS